MQILPYFSDNIDEYLFIFEEPLRNHLMMVVMVVEVGPFIVLTVAVIFISISMFNCNTYARLHSKIFIPII